MIQLITKENFTTTNWSGGNTTELFIFPQGTSFKERNFSFRLSTASVETEESTFTPLPNIKRTLMVLEGEMELNHLKHHKKLLKKYDIDTFEGEWETFSKGKCINFNLMTKNNFEGIIKAIKIGPETQKKYDLALH